MHLSKEGHEERSLARARGANDEVEASAHEAQFAGDAKRKGATRGCKGSIVDFGCPAERRVHKADCIAVDSGGGKSLLIVLRVYIE